ncbi:MAG: hypothetical protein KF785_13330 [Gemmatimonadales bacterium]|nr:hypothetical protein [Gemmatimonadales bacterium]
MKLAIVPVLLSTLVLMGCGRADGAPASVTRDSAGVTIVENQAPLDGDSPRYRVDSVATVEIRSSRGEGHEFDTNVIPAKLSDGRIVVADPSAWEIHLFSPQGQPLNTFGRKGRGPGEFESITSIARFAGDSLVAYDVLLRRYSVFDGAGGFVRSGSFTAGTGMPIPVGAFHDGALLIRDGFPLRPSGTAGPSVVTGGQSGELQALTPLYRVPLNGASVDSIGAISGSEILLQATPQAMSMTPIHFGRTAIVTARDSAIVIGDGAGFDFLIRRETGELVGQFRRPAAAHPVTAAEVEVLITAQLASLPAGVHERMGQRLRETPHRSTKPEYDRVLLSDAGEIWIRQFTVSALGGGFSTWSVFSAKGEWLCDVPLPAAFMPYAISREHVVGTLTDENDGVLVQVRPLRSAR